MVFTGEDPLKRPDFYDLARHSVSVGLRTNITPSATPLLNAEAIDEFQKCRISRMAISLDGPDASTHDGLRQIDVTYEPENRGRGGINGRLLWRTTAVSDGRGFVFISHTGEIYPSGFLPVSGGNVRNDSLVDVYQNSSLFRILREPSAKLGKCSYCEFTKICGGSRARAYALTGNYLEADPRCRYQPAQQGALVTTAR